MGLSNFGPLYSRQITPATNLLRGLFGKDWISIRRYDTSLEGVIEAEFDIKRRPDFSPGGAKTTPCVQLILKILDLDSYSPLIFLICKGGAPDIVGGEIGGISGSGALFVVIDPRGESGEGAFGKIVFGQKTV